MERDVFDSPSRDGAAPVRAPGNARSLSARELLSKLEGAERDELQRAMQARDLEAVRVILSKHAALAEVRKNSDRACLDAPNPMMKPRGWSGPARPPRGGGQAA